MRIISSLSMCGRTELRAFRLQSALHAFTRRRRVSGRVMQLVARRLFFGTMSSRGGFSLLDSAYMFSCSALSLQHSCHPLPTYGGMSFVNFGSAALCSSSLSNTSAPGGRRRSLRQCDTVGEVGKCNEVCFFGNVKSSPPPIHVLSCRFRTVEGDFTSPTCQNRTCLFPSCAAPRFE